MLIFSLCFVFVLLLQNGENCINSYICTMIFRVTTKDQCLIVKQDQVKQDQDQNMVSRGYSAYSLEVCLVFITRVVCVCFFLCFFFGVCLLVCFLFLFFVFCLTFFLVFSY